MIHHLDHLVLTTTNEQACVDFYVGLLGMALTTFGDGRKAFRFGQQKINVHVKGAEFEPKAHLPVPGALDLCFIARSEEHTSELQSLMRISYAVFCLKKKYSHQ